MLRQLISLELKYHLKGFLSPIAAAVFIFLGYMITAHGIKIPMVNINAPYFISYAIGLCSIGGIFVVALLGANTMLKDSENKMEAILHSAPVSKIKFLSAKYIALIIASFIICSCISIGQILALSAPSVSPDRISEFSLFNYFWSLLLIMLPNIILFSSFIIGIGGLTKNRIAVYVAGIMIYILYMAGSVFAGAPWMAGISTMSNEAYKVASLLDPLGLSAFFKQSKAWSAVEMNTQLLSLSGYFLLNRILWLSIAFIAIFFTYDRFSFRQKNAPRRKKNLDQTNKESIPDLSYKAVKTKASSSSALYSMWWSLFKMELKAILKSIPFMVILLLWLFLFGMELFGQLSGGTRMEGEYPITANMLSLIMELLPVYGLLVVIFFSNESIWRNKLLKIDQINDAVPVANWQLYSTKFFALFSIPLLLILSSIIVAILVQVLSGYYHLELFIYLKAFYFAGLPLILVSALALFIQALSSNRYLGMLLTAVLVLLLTSPLSILLGVEHPLWRYAAPLFTLTNVEYSDFAGFGAYADAFHWRMLYSLGIAMTLVWLSYKLWNRGVSIGLIERLSQLKDQVRMSHLFIPLISIIVVLVSAGFIFYKTNIENEYLSREDFEKWSQDYEEKYKQYEHMPQPIITAVLSEVDLYPSDQSYKVKAKYTIKNKSEGAMDSALVYLHKASKLDSISIDGAHIVEWDKYFGHFWLKFDRPLKTNEERNMYVAFHSSWSGFDSHLAKNAIIENGSFMRISEFFPQFGYNPELEITNEDLRKERGLSERSVHINSIQDFNQGKAKGKDFYDRISYETIVSTEAPQTVIGQGELINEWKEGERNYFHYKMNSKIPFRFAFSSAIYEKMEAIYRGTKIEVFYHPSHHYNVDLIIDATKLTLDYCEENFSPYQYNYFRYAEVAGFTDGFAATSYPATIYHIENKGFLSQIDEKSSIDIISQFVGHEMGHQWWGGQLDPPAMEGAIILTESLAQYTELMIYEKVYNDQDKINRALALEEDLYLDSRGFQKEVPLVSAAYDHPHIPYSKGINIMYSVKELLGEQSFNKVLRSLIQNHAYPQNPPSINDLLKEIYSISKKEEIKLIDDWFKKITSYDLSIENAKLETQENGEYILRLELKSRKWYEDGSGAREHSLFNQKVQIATYFDEDGSKELHTQMISQEKTGEVLKVIYRYNKKPKEIIIDPNHQLIDSNRDNNSFIL